MKSGNSEKVRIFFDNGKKEILDNLKVNTNFNREKLDSIFSNLTSLNLMQLINLSEDYKKLGLSGTEIKSHLYKLYSLTNTHINYGNYWLYSGFKF